MKRFHDDERYSDSRRLKHANTARQRNTSGSFDTAETIRHKDEDSNLTKTCSNHPRLPSCWKSFETWPSDRFDKPFPFFRKPLEIGQFSQNYRRDFHHDSSQLKHYIVPPDPNNVDFNLRIGYRNFIQRDESVKEYLDHLLQWIHLNRKKFHIQGKNPELKSSCLNTDFVCWRGLLTKLLCTPYENREGWMIAATMHNKTIYLCEFDTEQKLEYRAKMTDREKEMTYWGYKFEQYVTAEPGSKPNTERPVNNHEGFCSVVRSRLKEHSLVYGGEVDCCEPGELGDKQLKYVELKTSREMETNRQFSNFKKFKLIKWWAQSFLIGIPQITCGFRDDNGIVHRLETFQTLNIPKYCQDIHSPWNAAVCFNFLDEFLQFVKTTVTTNDPRVVYLFTYEPRQHIQCEELPKDSKFCFLPSWYTSMDSPQT